MKERVYFSEIKGKKNLHRRGGSHGARKHAFFMVAEKLLGVSTIAKPPVRSQASKPTQGDNARFFYVCLLVIGPGRTGPSRVQSLGWLEQETINTSNISEGTFS